MIPLLSGVRVLLELQLQLVHRLELVDLALVLEQLNLLRVLQESFLLAEIDFQHHKSLVDDLLVLVEEQLDGESIIIYRAYLI